MKRAPLWKRGCHVYNISEDDCYERPIVDVADAVTILSEDVQQHNLVEASVEEFVSGQTIFYRIVLLIPSKHHEIERGYTTIDLSKVRITLFGRSLSNVNLPPHTLHGHPMSWSGSASMNFSDISMKNLRSQMSFQGYQFHRSNFNGANFEVLSFTDCDLRGCDLTGMMPLKTSKVQRLCHQFFEWVREAGRQPLCRRSPHWNHH